MYRIVRRWCHHSYFAYERLIGFVQMNNEYKNIVLGHHVYNKRYKCGKVIKTETRSVYVFCSFLSIVSKIKYDVYAYNVGL